MSPEKKQALPSPSKISMSPTAQPHWKTSPTCLWLARFFFHSKVLRSCMVWHPFGRHRSTISGPPEQPTEHVSKAKNYVAKSAKVKVNLKIKKINKQDTWKLKYPLKIDGWKMKFPFRMVLFRDMLIFTLGVMKGSSAVWSRHTWHSVSVMVKNADFNQQKEQFHTYN